MHRTRVWTLPAALLLAALLAAPAAAQDNRVTSVDYALGRGDDGATAFSEPNGWWQVHHAVIQHNGSGFQLGYSLDAGFTHTDTFCDCTIGVSEGDGQLTITIPDDQPAGTYDITLLLTGPDGTLTVPNLGPGTVRLLVPDGFTASGPGTPILEGEATVYPDAGPGDVFAIRPTTGPATTVTTTVTNTVTETGTDDGFDLVALGLGLIAGAMVWALLVGRGVVQKRARKQVVTQATHKSEARQDPKLLEARKRTLMAALKDLEKAKISGDVDTATYDALKTDLKRQTVTVMRALEESQQK